MDQPSFFENLRNLIGNLAFDIFLWSIRMTEVEYHQAILDDVRRELSESKNA